ncbi:MAG: peptidyl-prolyl cis-trans isomerase C [Thermoproteota archaeon]|jgi:peptidyl-prolyl cis-trans isomerase C
MSKKFNARHILVENEFEAKDILKKLDNGESFEQLAKDFSQCSSSEQGGNLGLFSKGMMVESFEKAMLKLKKGEISAPVRTQFGFHLIERLPLKEESLLKILK